MKKFIFFVFLIFFCNNLIFADEITFSPESSLIATRYIDVDAEGSSSSGYSYIGVHDIGYYKITYWDKSYQEQYTRTMHHYSLVNIPEDAVNIKATLSATFNIPGEVVLLPDNVSTDPYTLYTAIGAASPILDIPYGNSGYTTDITSHVTSRINQGYINLGVRSSNSSLCGYTTVRIILTYDLPVRIIIKNNPNFGKVIVNGVEQNSGYEFLILKGTSITIEGKNQSTEYNGYSYVWNDYASKNKSNWMKTGVTDPVATTKAYTFRVDGSATYEAMLRKNYKITRTDRTEYGDYPNQATSYIVEENTASISVPATKSINGKTLPFGGWYDISGDNLTPTENMTLIALYKDLHITNSNNQFSNGSQNRFLRSSVSGYYHLVYESMGKIWYEISTDGGTTWYLANGGKSVSDKPARNPSLAVAPNGLVGIVYQSQNIEDNELYDIKFSYFSEGGTKFYDIMVQEGGPSGGFPDPYYQNANPVCSFTSSSLILFAWSDITAGTILYRLGSTNSSTLINNFIWLMEESNWISSQYIIKNPSLTGFPHNYSSATEGAFYLAFEEKISDASTKIKFKKIPVQYSNSIGAYITMPATFISMASGYEKNFYPSIAVNPSNKDDYRVACLSEGSSGKKASYYGYGSAGGGYTFSAGTYVGSVNMKIVNNEAIMGWSNYYTSSCQFAQLGYPYYYTKNLNINGYVQISGGASLSNTKAISLVASSAPCTFALSNSLNTLSKNSPDSTSEGKNLIIAKGDAEYVFGVHNVQLNGNKILLNKNMRFNEENRSLETMPFTAGLQSTIVFRIKSGKIAPDSIIINPDEYLYYNLDLVDKNTGTVIRNLYRTGNMTADTTGLNYKDVLIDLSGLSGKELTLHLSADVHMDSCRFIESVEINETSGYDLAKAEKITMDEETVPTIYALSQNYPNPFNPSTVISYDIPEASRVTLKVYDILGREVADLVNEFKEAGRYNVKFDASHLSTGIYIYQLRANDYVAVKKMSFVK